MNTYEVRKNGEVLEEIYAHKLKVSNKTAVFYVLGEIDRVIVLDPGMDIRKVNDLEPFGKTAENVARYFAERNKPEPVPVGPIRVPGKPRPQ